MSNKNNVRSRKIVSTKGPLTIMKDFMVQNSRPRNIVLGVTTAVFLGYAGVKGLDTYYNQKVFESIMLTRGRSFDTMDSVVRERLQQHIKSKSISDKRGYFNAIERANVQFDATLDDFVDFVKLSQEKIDTLTTFGYEQKGFITYKDGRFSIVETKNQTYELSNLVDSFMKGDIEKRSEIELMLNNLPGLRDRFEYFDMIPQLLSIFETYLYAKDDLLAHTEDTASISIYDEAGILQKKITKKEYMQNIKTVEEALNQFKTSLTQMTGFDPFEIVNQKDTWARYHTHPLDDINYMPSSDDEKNTIGFVPSVLFSQSNDSLRVYAMHNGETKLVYSASLADTTK